MWPNELGAARALAQHLRTSGSIAATRSVEELAGEGGMAVVWRVAQALSERLRLSVPGQLEPLYHCCGEG